MMDCSSTFPLHLSNEATHHVICSAVIAVPAVVVVHTLKNIESIKRYGVDGGVISSCVMENLVPPSEVGAVRRCTVRLPPFADKVVREKLTHYVEHRHKGGDETPYSDEGELSSVEITLEHVPCAEGERHRSPFEPAVQDASQMTRTHIRISGVTRTPHRCFVEMDAECVLSVHSGQNVPTEDKLYDKACRRAVTDFWRLYLDAQLSALEQHVCKETFPEVEARVDADYRAAFTAHEEVLCSWAADSSETMPRHAAVDELESTLVWWSRALEAYRHQKMLTEVAEALVQRVGPSSAALKQQMPQRFTEAQKPNGPLRLPSESSSKGEVTPDMKHLLPSMSDSHSEVVASMPGFLSPYTYTTKPAPTSKFICSGSQGPTAIVGKLNRPSVLLPPDRRHTAVPKKSFVSSSSPLDGELPIMTFTPTSSFAAMSSQSSTSTSNALQASIVSHSGRRKPMAVPPPHLLQHAQRRLSNVNTLSNSTSRQTMTAITPPCTRTGEPTGYFFSQLFTTPAYTASMANATTTTAAAGAATSSAAPLSTWRASVTTALPPATAQSSSAPNNSTTTTVSAAPPEAIEPFQPDMVRHLFSLVGVLQEDVARRIFLSLCTKDGSAGLFLNAEGLKNVLRYLDPCGLREGGMLSRGDAAACDEAYRAEVQRCYYEQNMHSTSTNKKRMKTSKPVYGNNSGPSPSEESSTLSRLTAQREANFRESDEVALDKMVQSTLSRFAFRKKQRLSYEEFQLALLYLHNN